MRFVVLLGVMFVLASCSNYSSTQTPSTAPQKVFQYAYQDPDRVPASPEFSAALNKGKSGALTKVRLSNQQTATAKLGRPYFSASGYKCRKYSVQTKGQYTACNIGGRWYNASPIVLKK